MTIIQPKLPRVEFYPGKTGKRYMPSNGSEGEYFHAMWCEECAKDNEMNGTCWREKREPEDEDLCRILGDSFIKDGVAEWVYGDDGQPKCTAFVKYVEPRPDLHLPPSQVVRDDRTPDMFGEP